MKKRIYYDTYISIIRNNEPISFIPFRGNVSNEELEATPKGEDCNSYRINRKFGKMYNK